MVRGRIDPKTKNRYKRRMRDVHKGLSRKVAIYKQPIKSECIVMGCLVTIVYMMLQLNVQVC